MLFELLLFSVVVIRVFMYFCVLVLLKVRVWVIFWFFIFLVRLLLYSSSCMFGCSLLVVVVMFRCVGLVMLSVWVIMLWCGCVCVCLVVRLFWLIIFWMML